jgi:HEAT repeat protein
VEDQEKRRVVKETIAPYRSAMKDGCSLCFALALIAALSGHWIWVFAIVVISLLGMMAAGNFVMNLGPASWSQRSMYEASLSMDDLFRGDRRWARRWPTRLASLTSSPARWLVRAAGRHTPFVRAVRSGDEGLTWLIRKLESGSAFDRWRAAVALGKVGKANSIGPLMGRLKDEDPRVREAATAALKKIEGPESGEALVSILGSTEDDIVWLTALSALYFKGDRPPFDQVRLTRAVNLIRAEPEDDKKRLASLLSALPTEDVEDMLREEIVKEPLIDLEVFKNLARQSSPRAIQLLRESLTGDDRRIRSVVLSLGETPPRELEADLERVAREASGFTKQLAELKLKAIRSGGKAAS